MRTYPTLRAATPDDVEAIAQVWHHAWGDGHLGHVPEELHPHRRLADFRQRVPSRLDCTTVAADGSQVIGFVTVRGDEIEQMYVTAQARGTGLADVLLRHGEQRIATRYERAWLAVVAGNARARRFYARNGWQDAAATDYPAEVATGTVTVPCRRYEKRVTR